MASVISVTLLGLGDHVCRQTLPLIRRSFRVFWNNLFFRICEFLAPKGIKQ